MSDRHNLFNSLQKFDRGQHRQGLFYSLPQLEKAGVGLISKLPVSIRLVLESVLRNCDGKRVSESNVRALANWKPSTPRTEEIPFVVARIVLQDFTGVPLLVDLAAMRSAVARLGKNPKLIEPLVPVDLVVDHSVQVDYSGTPDALQRNLEMEFRRNRERYQFLKWGMQAFETFKVVPPGIGIVHQVNLEFLAKGVLSSPPHPGAGDSPLFYPDTLVGTDSHTTMINGLGIVGWGVGGIEAEAGMLGQPVYFLTPDVVGVHLHGALREGVTATDLALTITQMLRKAKVVGKFVEFYGPGATALPVVDRATIANMAPEYGATMGFFPIDSESVSYFRATGRSDELCQAYESYYRAQGLFGIPSKGEIAYSVDLDLDLATIVPSVAGPKRPQDRIELPDLRREFVSTFTRSTTENGFGKTSDDLTKLFEVVAQDRSVPGGGSQEPVSRQAAQSRNTNPTTELEMANNRPTPDVVSQPSSHVQGTLRHGSVLIAAITSCTNTSNPSVMLAAGLLAKKAVERGLAVNPLVKTSLAPGSRVVTDYLEKAGLQSYLDQLGFNVVGYGCTTCIGNSGPLAAQVDEALGKYDLVAASVLSGNRNFEARVHQSIKANFLMSPPLVVAFALAGRVDIDLTTEPLGKGKDGQAVFLKDIWPSLQEVRDLLQATLRPEVFRRLYSDFVELNPKWNEISSSVGNVYQWDSSSTYIQEPPFFLNFSLVPGTISEIKGARPLGIFGDSVTTDHISPAGSIKKSSPAGKYLIEHGVSFEEFNSYGSRRGNDRVMTRGTFANVRIKNLMVPGTEGGLTKVFPAGAAGASPGEPVFIFDASLAYQKQGTSLVIVAGQEYGTGSSRDWAAKGTALLGVRAVIAQSFERIHRSNLVGMGVLPLQFKEGVNAQTLRLDGTESFDILGLGPALKPQQDLTVQITRVDGRAERVPVTCRIDTPIEIDYYQHGGILNIRAQAVARCGRGFRFSGLIEAATVPIINEGSETWAAAPFFRVNPRVLDLAEHVIRKTDRDHPADAELRLEFKRQSGLSRAETAEITRAVFSYFRWRGWLTPQHLLSNQVRQSLQLAEQFARSPESFGDPELVDRVVPSWLHGEMEVTPDLARFLQKEPQLWLRARPGQGRVLADRLKNCAVLGEGPLSDALAYHGYDDLFRTSAFHNGEFELQDISSQAVGLVCGPVPGETWWDACAGEGGKLLHLSDLMNNKGLIWASDRAEWRLRQLKRRAARARVFNYRTALWDGGSKLPTKTKFDGVLVDAPCSGTGTWQRNPHARWTLTATDLDELNEIQLHLLIHCAAAVKPGGKLIFSVCSLARSETLKVVEAFEHRCSNFSRLRLKDPLSVQKPESGTLLFRPQDVGGNGMFIAGWLSGRMSP